LRSNTSARRRQRHNAALLLFLTPYLVGMIVLVVAPALLSFSLAFTEYDALSPPRWQGFQNFRELFANPLFWIAVRNSLMFVLLAVPLRVFGALAMALLLNQRRRGVGVYRVAVYLPTVIPDVAYALIWLWIFNPIYGPLNVLLGAVGLPQPAWLATGTTALLAIVIMSAFQIGEGLVVLLAGRQAIPEDFYQSAALDGGNRWQLFRWITLPLLMPWLLLLTIRDIIMSAQSSFAPAYLMTGGGPYYATFFMPLLVYQEAFDRFRFGHGAALLLLMFVGVGILLLLLYYLVGGWRYAGDY
jgi:multiple sugar transport system permease protein